MFGGVGGRLRHDQERADIWNAEALLRGAALPPGLALSQEVDDEEGRMQEDVSSGEEEYLAEVTGMTVSDDEGAAPSGFSRCLDMFLDNLRLAPSAL